MRILACVPLVVLVVLGACFSVGGPPTVMFQTLVLSPDAGATAASVAQRVQGEMGELVLVTAANQSDEWFGQVAEQTGLRLSGPGRTGSRAMAFLTSIEALGDTSIVLGLQSGGRIHMHDALYTFGDERLIDLMLVDMEDVTDLRDGVRTLFSYIASDVGSNVPIVLGVHAPTAQISDSVTVLMRAFLASGLECAARSAEGVISRSGNLALLYGPSVRTACESASPLQGQGGGIRARLIVGR